MFSYLDLIIVFFISICFITLFKIQQKVSPASYFSSSQLIVGDSISLKMILQRYFLIFFFGLLAFLIFKNESIILLGVLLGSFLIIWPTILSPLDSYYYINKKLDILIIHLSNFIFVITSVIIVYVSSNFFPLISDYVSNNNTDIAWDFLFWFILSIFGFPMKGRIDSILEQRIKNNNKYSQDFYED